MNKLGRLAAVPLMTLALGGCGKRAAVLGPDAEPSLPIKLKICDPDYTNCTVKARFDTMDSCKFHERIGNMLCDSLSDPTMITCRDPGPSVAAVGVCTE